MRQTLIIDKHNASLEYDNACLVLRLPDEPVRRTPLRYLERVVCLHHTDVHTRAMAYMQASGVDFVYLNSRNSELCFSLQAPHQAQSLRRCRQYQLTLHHTAALSLAQFWVRYKISCAQRLLQELPEPLAPDSRGPQPQPSPPTKACEINQLQQAASAQSTAICCIADLQMLRRSIRSDVEWEQLRGIEGAAQRLLFGHWRQQLPAQLGFTHRQRRPPSDPVNAILSLTYTLAYHEAIRQCHQCGLDPWLGFYHRQAPGRQSLACDLMEPLRVDLEAWVVKLFTEKTLTLREFGHQGQACLLGKQGRSTYYQHWYTELPRWSAQLNRLARRLARHIDRLPLSPAFSRAQAHTSSL